MHIILEGELSFIREVKERRDDNGNVQTPAHQKLQFSFIDADRGFQLIEVKDIDRKISHDMVGKIVKIPVQMSVMDNKLYYRVA